MPRYSERAARILSLTEWITGYLHHKVWSPASHPAMGVQLSLFDLDTDISGSTRFARRRIQELRQLESNRYLSRPLRRVEAPSFTPPWVYDNSLLTTREFRVLFRMTRESFDELLSRIDDNPVFFNESSCPQRCPEFQLQVTLYHFGGGATGSRMRTAMQFGIAEGTAHLYVYRVTKAILDLQNEYIQWPIPGSPEYTEVEQRHLLRYGFPNCMGFVDGTLVPVYRKPTKQGERYFTRKSTYSLNATAIVDSTSRILFVIAGSKLSLWDTR